MPSAARVSSPGRAASQAPGRSGEKNEEFSSQSVGNETNCKALKSRSSGGERKSLLRARLGVLRAEGLLQGLAPSLPTGEIAADASSKRWLEGFAAEFLVFPPPYIHSGFFLLFLFSFFLGSELLIQIGLNSLMMQPDSFQDYVARVEF